MWEFLRETNAAGTTIILTTHYLERPRYLSQHRDHRPRPDGRGTPTWSARARTPKTESLNLAAPFVALPLLPGYVLDRVDDTTLEVEVSKETGMNALFAGSGRHTASRC